MSDDEAGSIGDDEIREALTAIKGGEEIALKHLTLLAAASVDRNQPLAPPAITEAVCAKWDCDADFFNGGADQFVWNNGAQEARRCANAFRCVGAVENADLLDRLAAELEAFQAETTNEDLDTVHRFLAYRKRVNGPFFGIPEPGDELAEALIEYAIEHRADFPDPSIDLAVG